MGVTVTEVSCRSILNRSRIADIDYTVNPYLGCGHGCRYCYAVFMKRLARKEGEWGTFVDVKTNAPLVLRKQLARSRPGLVTLSTVTDSYQPLERKYRLTRMCLEELAGSEFEVSILTKSDLVLRDLDVLGECRVNNIGVTITTLDEEVRRRFEPGAPSVGRRLEALKEMSSMGFNTWVFLGPVIPFFSDNPEGLREMLLSFEANGVGEVLVDTLNLKGKNRGRVMSFIQETYPQALDYYLGIYRDIDSYRDRLREMVYEASSGLSIEASLCF